MADSERIDQPTGIEKVGHEWDGIEELNTPLPRWWLWTFYATIVFSVAYMVAYPAWPLLNGATEGVLGWSSHGQLDADVKADQQRKSGTRSAIAQSSLEQIAASPQLMQASVEGGRSIFKVACVQCHGSGAAGSNGFPNLNDDDWLWGGDLASILRTIEHGVRQPGHEATRNSQMLAFGRDGLLTPDQIGDVAAYVRVISGQQKGNAASMRGAKAFAENCVTCHGIEGKGNRAFGAPNLTDPIWLYGGDQTSIVATVTDGRQGVMPRWGNRLDPVTLKMLAAYVYSLGGGERNEIEIAQGAAANVQP